jgi:hypothetical protein
MLCTLPVYKGDVDRLLDLVRWMRQLGGCKDHAAVIVADAATPASDAFKLKNEASHVFSEIEITATDRSVMGWPEGPNELFLAAARFAKQRNMHWLFLEPDAVPLCPGWLDKIDIEYRVRGARYLGQIVPCDKPGLPMRHFTGVGVYPADAITQVEAPVLQNFKKAFDISTADVIVAEAQNSELFQHLWGEKGNPPTFAHKGIPGTGTFGLDYLRKGAVLFHRTKDGKLINLLRQRAGLLAHPPPRFPFIQLGRFGDIILLLPAMKHLADTTGTNPKMIVSRDYASVLDGVSYVDAISLPVHWWNGMPEARAYAEAHYGGGTVLQCYAHEWGIDIQKWPNFMTSMLDRTGVSLELFNDLPLVFDRRNPQRELSAVPKLNGKPYVAINTIGVSSPFPHGKKVFEILKHLAPKVALIDMSRIQCHRIYDLLGVMDHAIGTITTDTATLHLAHGCPRPYIALTVDGWCSSTPRGNCKLEVKYSRFMSSLSAIVDTVESWL